MPLAYRVSPGSAAYYVGFAAAWFGAIAYGVIATVDFEWSLVHVIGGLVGCVIALIPAGSLVFFPYEIRVVGQKTLEFRRLRGRMRVEVDRIHRMASDEDDVVIEYDGGRVHLVAVGSFVEPLTRIVELNPEVELVGWIRGVLEDARAKERA